MSKQRHFRKQHAREWLTAYFGLSSVPGLFATVAFAN
jgi:hypothetical protein